MLCFAPKITPIGFFLVLPSLIAYHMFTSLCSDQQSNLDKGPWLEALALLLHLIATQQKEVCLFI